MEVNSEIILSVFIYSFADEERFVILSILDNNSSLGFPSRKILV